MPKKEQRVLRILQKLDQQGENSFHKNLGSQKGKSNCDERTGRNGGRNPPHPTDPGKIVGKGRGKEGT